MFHCRKCKDTFYSQSLPSFYRQVLRCEPYPFLVTSAIWHYAGRPRWSRCQPWTEDQAPSLPCPLQCTAGDDGSVADISCMSIFSRVQGLLPRRQLAATRWSAQIPVRAHCFGCISQIKFCWKLPHFRSPDIFFPPTPN